MKKLIIAFLLLVSIGSQAQVVQKINTFGVEYKRVVVDSFLRIALDSLQNAPDGSISFVNHAFYMKDTMWKLIVVPAGTSTVWGTIAGNINDQSDLQTALGLRVPKITTITIDGITLDLSANRNFGDFLNPGDTMYLHNAITAIQTYTNNLNFNDGLHQAGNNVVALHDEGLWNASKFQGRNVSSSTPLNGQVYAWDSVLLVWKPTTITSGSTITAGYGLTGTTTFKVDTSLVSTLAHLYKVADSLGALISGGATPTLQQVLTAGSTLTADNIINASTHYLDISSANGGFHYSDNSGYWYSGVDGTHYTEVQFQSSNSSMSSNYAQLHSSYASAQNYLTVYPDFVDITSPIVIVNTGLDTLATRAYARSVGGGGGGGGTPNLSAVLAAGNSVSSGANSNTISASAIYMSDATNTLYLSPVTAYISNGAEAVALNPSYVSFGENGHFNNIRAQATLSGDRDIYWPDGNANDTVATLDNIRTALGGGGGSTPGIDDVLTVAQALTAGRTIDLNSHTLTLDHASSITSALLFKNTNTTAIYMPNTTDLKFEASGGGSMTVQGNGFIKTPYYGFPTGSFHMNTGTFNGVAAYWNTSGVLIEKAAGATNILAKTHANDGEEVYPFQGTIKVDATSGNTTLILGDPADGGFNTGGIMTFIKTDASANTVTVDAWTNWSATVNGVHTKTLSAQWQYIIVQSDGTNWYVVGGN